MSINELASVLIVPTTHRIRYLMSSYLASALLQHALVPVIALENADQATDLTFNRVIACGGSWRMTPKLYADGNFDPVRSAVAEAVALAKSCR